MATVKELIKKGYDFDPLTGGYRHPISGSTEFASDASFSYTAQPTGLKGYESVDLSEMEKAFLINAYQEVMQNNTSLVLDKTPITPPSNNMINLSAEEAAKYLLSPGDYSPEFLTKADGNKWFAGLSLGEQNVYGSAGLVFDKDKLVDFSKIDHKKLVEGLGDLKKPPGTFLGLDNAEWGTAVSGGKLLLDIAQFGETRKNNKKTREALALNMDIARKDSAALDAYRKSYSHG